MQRLYRIAIIGLVVGLLITPFAGAVTTVEGTNLSSVVSSQIPKKDDANNKLRCTDAPPGPILHLPGGTTLTANSCSTSTLVTTDICTNTAGGCPILDTNGMLPTAQVPPITVVVPTGMVCAGKTDTTTSTSTATSTGTLYQTAAQPVTCTVTKATTDIGIGNESPRTNFYAHWVGISNFYGLNPAGETTTASHAISVTSTPAVVMSASANVYNNPNLTVWPAGTYRMHLYANMASTPGSVYFVVYAGSTVIATSATVTVATGSLAAYDITATAATDYTTSVTTDALGVLIYASSASANNMTIGYGGANSTFVSAPWSAFSSSIPLVAGTASTGTSRVPAMSDHTHPAQTHASDDLYATTAIGASGGDYAFAYRTGTDTSTNTSTGTGTSCPLNRNCTLVRTSTTTATATVTNSVNGYAISSNPVLNYTDVGADASGAATIAVNSAVSGTSGNLCKFTGTHSVGNATSGTDYLAPNGVTTGGYSIVTLNNGQANGYAQHCSGTCTANRLEKSTDTNGRHTDSIVSEGTNAITINDSTTPVTIGELSDSTSYAGMSAGTASNVASYMVASNKTDTFANAPSASGTLSLATGGVKRCGVTNGGLNCGSLPAVGSNIDSSGNTTGHAAGDCKSDGTNCPSASTLGAVPLSEWRVKQVIHTAATSDISVNPSSGWTLAVVSDSFTTDGYTDVYATTVFNGSCTLGGTWVTICMGVNVDSTAMIGGQGCTTVYAHGASFSLSTTGRYTPSAAAHQVNAYMKIGNYGGTSTGTVCSISASAPLSTLEYATTQVLLRGHN